MVSIIIPCFNAEDFVADAIDSCLAQSYPNTEIIVVDDGSTDASIDRIRQYGNKLHLIQLQHAGACVARNTGLQHAAGSLIQFLDADDKLAPDKLAIQVAFLQSHPEVDLVACMGFLFGDGKGVRRKKGELRNPDPQGRDPFIHCLQCGLSTEAPLIRRDPLLKVGGFRIIPCGQESDLHIRLGAANCNMHRLSEPLIYHREHNAAQRISRTPRPPSVMLGVVLSMAQCLMDNPTIYDLSAPERRAALANKLVIHAIGSIRARESLALPAKALSLAESLSKGSSNNLESPFPRYMAALLGRMNFERFRLLLKP